MEKIKKIPILNKILYGAGDITGTIVGTIIPSFYFFFLNMVAGLDPRLAGLVIGIGTVWDAITDPLVGSISDKINSRFGRRRVFLALFAVPLGISFISVWFVSNTWTDTEIFIYSLFAFILFKTFTTLIGVPYVALTSEMTDDYNERTSLTAYRMFFSIFFGLVAFIIPGIIIEQNGNSIETFKLIAIVFSPLVIICPYLAFFGSFEQKGKSSTRTKLSIIQKFKLIWKNHPFRFAILMYFFTWTSFALINNMIIYFIYFVLEDVKLSLLIPIMAIVMGTATLALPLWVYLSGKFEKKQAFIIGMSVMVIGLFLIMLIDISNFTLIYILCFFIGLGVSAVHVIPPSIIPDAIDYGNYISKNDNEGVYFGILTFIQKLGVAAAISAAGYIISYASSKNIDAQGNIMELSTNIPLKSYPNLEIIQLAVKINFSIIPLLIIIIGMIAAIFYPLTRNKHKIIVKRVNQVREREEKSENN